MELWQAMAALGQHRHPHFWHAPVEEGGQRPGGAVPSRGAPATGEQRIARDRDLLAARRYARQHGLPEPEPTPDGDVGVQQLRGVLAGG